MDVAHQALDDGVLLVEQRAAHDFGRVRGEHRLDRQPRQECGELVERDPGIAQLDQHRLEPAGLRRVAAALVVAAAADPVHALRSEEHTSELQSLMRISYAVFCLKKKKTKNTPHVSRATSTPKQAS